MRLKRADLHTHTTFSDGRGSLEAVVASAKEQSLEVLAITDHYDAHDFRPKIALLEAESLLEHFTAIRALSVPDDLILYCGLETTPLPNGLLDIEPEVLAVCDLIITSCHYIPFEGEIVPGEYFNDQYWALYKEIMLLMAAGEGDIVGHCEDYLPIERFIEGLDTTYADRREICRAIVDRYLDRAYVDAFADRLLSSGKLCELHCATETPRGWVIQRLADRGVRFTPGSDAHAVSHVGMTAWAYTVSNATGAVLCTTLEEIHDR
ncbi:MAG TPA: PHP domain-containing protein [Sphaerochaeta sp.]|nr:PHP domain-containing protein [Sphaerochaeta sp.]HQB90095.1 PHP domain-containing protein [Sphaerochaeta sp.]